MELVHSLKTKGAVSRHTLAGLVDEHSDSLYRFCRSLAYTREDAEDLFQETFVRALEQLPKLRGSDNPRNFLFSTALYLWKSWKRKHARRNHLAPVGPLDDNMAGAADTEESIMKQERIQTVRKLVEALPEELRIPTILYYTVEMKVRDIAATLKLPVGTVKSRLFKARKLVEKGLVAFEYDFE